MNIGYHIYSYNRVEGIPKNLTKGNTGEFCGNTIYNTSEFSNRYLPKDLTSENILQDHNEISDYFIALVIYKYYKVSTKQVKPFLDIRQPSKSFEFIYSYIITDVYKFNAENIIKCFKKYNIVVSDELYIKLAEKLF